MSAAPTDELLQGFRLGPWLVEPLLNRISAEPGERHLEGKVMSVLVALAARRGALVTKDELLEQVWPNVIVVEGVIKRCVAELREALGDDAHHPRFIETIARKGYRLIAAVQPIAEMPTAVPAADRLAVARGPSWFASRRGALNLAGTVAALAIVIAWLLSARQSALENVAEPSTGAAAERNYVAVLPFDDFSADTSRTWLAAGLTEEIIHSLANVPGLRVAARTSSFAFSSGAATIPEIARKLNVGTVLEGSIRIEGDTIRVVAQLIDARTGLHLWSQVYERPTRDLFTVQDDIARNITHSLRGMLTENGDSSYASRAPPSDNFEAYALYLHALSLWRERGVESQLRAADLLRAAITMDAEFARAHAVLGNVYWTMVFYAGMPFEEMAALAERAAREALRLNPDDSDALSLLGTIARSHLDWTNALRFAEAAVAADPSSSIAQQRHAEVLLAMGYLRRAAAQIERAVDVDPVAASVRSVAALAAVVNGDQDGALGAASATRALGSPRAGQIESWVHVERGDFELARAARLESASGMRRWSEHVEPVYAALVDRQRVPEALAVLAGAPQPVASTEGFFFYEYAILGDMRAAESALERLEGSTDTFPLLWLPELAPLRVAPGFAEAMQRLGLAEYWHANGMPDLCEQRSGRIVCH